MKVLVRWLTVQWSSRIFIYTLLVVLFGLCFVEAAVVVDDAAYLLSSEVIGADVVVCFC